MVICWVELDCVGICFVVLSLCWFICSLLIVCLRFALWVSILLRWWFVRDLGFG